MGHGLIPQPGFMSFTASSLGLDGDMEVQIPKSINRLRLKGSGTRYVHGGATLQEIVLPVVQINKKRESDISKVEVDILRGATTMITSGQFTATFYQLTQTNDKVQPRTLRAGIYSLSGELLSDRHELRFDTKSDNAREREMQVRFLLTQNANQINNQDVVLRLEEKIEGTNHYQEYKTQKYLMRRSIASDF